MSFYDNDSEVTLEFIHTWCHLLSASPTTAFKSWIFTLLGEFLSTITYGYDYNAIFLNPLESQQDIHESVEGLG